MKKIILTLFALSVLSAPAFAGPTCTESEKSTWMNQETFKKDLVKQGYKIKKFKVTTGNCYEIYGWDKDSKKVEIYFNPITAKVVKKRSF